MNLTDLKKMGAFTPTKVTAREVAIKRPVMRPQEEWADNGLPEHSGEFADETITVHIRRGSAADAIEYAQADRREQPFIAIHRFVCAPDGSPLFPNLATAMRIETWLAMPLFEAISEAHGTLPKSSRRKTSGGANSRSLSAEERSKSGSTPSASAKSASGSSTERDADP